MTSTEIEIRDVPPPDAATFLPSLSTAGRVWNLAQQIAGTEFVPGSLRGKPAAIMAAMLTGREIGIGAMHSLRAIDVIDGRPSLSPELLHALALRAGHDVDVEDSTRSSCTVAIRRHGWPTDRVRRVTFDEVDARLAGLVGEKCKPAEGVHVNDRQTRAGKTTCGCKQGYRTYPRAMYRARAIAEGVRTYLPDVAERIGYVAEEFGAESHPPHAEQVEVVREVAGDEIADEIEVVHEPDEVEALDDDVPVDDDPDDGTPAEPAPAPKPDDDGPAAHDVCDLCGAVEGVDDHDLGKHGRAERAAARGAEPPPIPEEAAPCDVCGAGPAEDHEPIAHEVAERAAGYADLNVGEVCAQIKRGDLDPWVAWALEVEIYAGGDPSRARKTVRALVVDKGVDVTAGDGAAEAARSRQGAPEGPTEDGTGAGTNGPENATSPAVHVPADMTPAERSYRSAVLGRYRQVYREVYARSQRQAGELHALRLETIGGDDAAILWVPRSEVERLEHALARFA